MYSCENKIYCLYFLHIDIDKKMLLLIQCYMFSSHSIGCCFYSSILCLRVIQLVIFLNTASTLTAYSNCHLVDIYFMYISPYSHVCVRLNNDILCCCHFQARLNGCTQFKDIYFLFHQQYSARRQQIIAGRQHI